MTCEEIAEHTGLALGTVRRYMKRFHQKPGIVWVEDWKRTGNIWTAKWAMGAGMYDKPKPKPGNNAEHCRKHRLKRLMEAEKVSS